VFYLWWLDIVCVHPVCSVSPSFVASPWISKWAHPWFPLWEIFYKHHWAHWSYVFLIFWGYSFSVFPTKSSIELLVFEGWNFLFFFFLHAFMIMIFFLILQKSGIVWTLSSDFRFRSWCFLYRGKIEENENSFSIKSGKKSWSELFPKKLIIFFCFFGAIYYRYTFFLGSIMFLYFFMFLVSLRWYLCFWWNSSLSSFVEQLL
jgi:hypothetical protein